MKILKRILAVCLVALLVFSFAACGGKDDKKTDGNVSGELTSVDEQTVINKADISFKNGDQSTYRIVRPYSADQKIFDGATDLFKFMKSNLGISPKNIGDDTEQGDAAEIIIGETNRPETAIAKQLLRQKGGRAGNFLIASINSSIVVYGLSDDSTIEALDYFKQNIVKNETVSGGINYVNTLSNNYSNITIGKNTDLIDYVIIKPYNNLSYITELEIEKLQKVFLEKYGYEVRDIKDEERRTAGAREIIIGSPMREGVEKIIEGDVVSIKVVGEKVYLNGGSTYAVAAAVTEFTNMLKVEGNVTLNDSSSKRTDYETVAKTLDKKTDYVAVFRDAFDSNIDTTKWNNFNDYNQYGQNGKWAKRAKEDYSNLSIQDGVFVTQICEDDEAYYGSMLTTQNKMAFKYGYFEISQIMPNGDSFWTSLWTRPAFATSLYWTEIDVNENFGMSSLSRGNCFPWLTDKGKTEGLKQQGGDICWENNYMMYYRYKDGVKTEWKDGDSSWEGADLYYNYHSYGCEWTYDTISFFRDGELLTEKRLDDLNQAIALGLRNQHSYLIVGCIAGSDNLTEELIENVTDKEWAETSRYYVDDVVVYQKDGMDIQFDYKDRHYGFTTKTHYND